MLNLDVLAYGINNLSDARYFSALGVRWMSFAISEQETEVSKLKEIIDWVEGVEILLEVDESNIDFVSFISTHLGVTKVLTSESAAAACAEKGLEPIIFSTERNGMPIFLVEECKVLDISHTPVNDLRRILDDGKFDSFAISGGVEERAGLRSFEDVEEKMELLADEDF